MDDRARQFRASRLDLLRFYASPPQQLEWQARTPTLGIDEPLEWWLEDFHPDSELFTAAFSAQEIELLKEFNRLFERASNFFPSRPYPPIEVALKHPAWIEVVKKARTRGSHVQMNPNKAFHATVLALRARPAREHRRWAAGGHALPA